jgi:hypothetical protein
MRGEHAVEASARFVIRDADRFLRGIHC